MMNCMTKLNIYNLSPFLFINITHMNLSTYVVNESPSTFRPGSNVELHIKRTKLQFESRQNSTIESKVQLNSNLDRPTRSIRLLQRVGKLDGKLKVSILLAASW